MNVSIVEEDNKLSIFLNDKLYVSLDKTHENFKENITHVYTQLMDYCDVNTLCMQKMGDMSIGQFSLLRQGIPKIRALDIPYEYNSTPDSTLL